MKTVQIILFLFAFSGLNQALSQSKYDDSARNCSKVVSELSYFWKIDSLGNNGARYYSYHRLLHCKIDGINPEFLKEKFGRENMLRKTNKGVEYIYFCLDAKALKKDYKGPYACWYVSFMFSPDQQTLLSIYEGDMDY
jgi:hypothetical protein